MPQTLSKFSGLLEESPPLWIPGLASDAQSPTGSTSSSSGEAALPSDARRFAYRAQTADGLPVLGSLQANDHDHARNLLTQMRLRVVELSEERKPAHASRLSAADFLAFNQQLAHLTQAGLPVEAGLRLIA